MRGHILAVSKNLNLNRLCHHISIEVVGVHVAFISGFYGGKHAAHSLGDILVCVELGTVESNGDFLVLVACGLLIEKVVQTDLALKCYCYVVNENGLPLIVSSAEAE